ncbi:WAT1-related protein At5g64700-like [Oryza brachyantha]|uniref:WAT1-related protein n=1 Tax=Oryza brachyantha TaxID=4533 RepID=J3N160_ORYBR|nr:WAT1-related protein At5g64700-like [Oryza brachyantha]
MAGEGKPDGGWAAAAGEGVMLPASMVLVQLFSVVLVLLSKLALGAGMRPFALLAYRNLVGAVAVAPLAFVFERKHRKIPGIVEWCWISLNATFGVILSMGLYYYGLQSTSATYSVIFLNMIPIVTSIVATIFRVEKLVLRNWPGKAKLLGIITCVGGTMVVSFYKGKLLHHPWPSHLLKFHSHDESGPHAYHRNMVAGTLFLCGSCLGYAFWFIIQVRLAKVFPSRYWATTLTCLSGSLQAFVIGILINPTKSVWTIKWNLQLLTVVYSGVFNTGVSFVLMSWAVKHRGPIYPSMFNSLSLIAMVIMDSVLLGTSIFLGCILGTSFIIVGLYAFLLGKGTELKQAAAVQNTDNKQDNRDGTEQRGDEILRSIA